MSDTITAYLIDPFAVGFDSFLNLTFTGDEIVREVQLAKGEHDTLHAMYAALSHPEHPVDTVDLIGLPGGDCIYVDDNGLYQTGHDRWFRIHGYHQPLKGRGLLLGCDENGYSAPPKMGIDQLRRNIQTGFDFTIIPGLLFPRNASGTIAKRKVPAKRDLLQFAVRHFCTRPWGEPGVLLP